jgi:hypothetical protein
MPRTYITSADGTLYEAIPARRALTRKIIRRSIGGIALIITALFLSAAIIGLNEAIHTPAPGASPTMTHTANAMDRGLSVASAKRACKIAKVGRQKGACINLYMRRAWYDTNNYTPAGKILVPDCISQYRGIELTYCFEQEIG